jgi:hypothetical protein
MSAIVFGGTIIVGNTLSYAEKDKHEHAEEITGRTLPKLKLPLCPTCKNVPVGPQKGRVTAPMAMTCPDCKKETAEFTIHHCDSCGKDILACMMCQKESEKSQTEAKEGKCPKCKMVRAWPIKGRTFAKWEMECPECKERSHDWLVHHCDKCDADFLACPMCPKEQKKTEK